MANRFNDRKYVMRLNRQGRMAVTGIAILVALSLSESTCWSQLGGGGYGGVGAGGYGPGGPIPHSMVQTNDPAVKAQIETGQALEGAIFEFRHAGGDDAKAAAQKKLVEALTRYFDADMKVREAWLQKVEAQLKTLRSQFDKRDGKKQEIIDLQMKLLENETDGLGFFGNPSAPAGVTGTMGLLMAPRSVDPGSGVVPPTFGAELAPAPLPRPSHNPPNVVPRTAPSDSERSN